MSIQFLITIISRDKCEELGLTASLYEDDYLDCVLSKKPLGSADESNETLKIVEIFLY